MKLAGKTSIVTGAASGIGRGTAIMMAKEGSQVVAVDINGEGLDQTIELIRENDGAGTACIADVGRDNDVQRMIQCALDTYDRLDILHNNAFWHAPGPICDLEETDWDRTLDVCLKALYLGCRHAIPAMKISGSGVIVNTASVHSLVGFRDYAGYDAAKGGVIGVTRSVAVDYGPQIRSNAVLPGAILTRAWDSSPDAAQYSYIDRCPMKRLGLPEDIASAVVFLASDEASFITGASLVVDGGLTIVGDA